MSSTAMSKPVPSKASFKPEQPSPMQVHRAPQRIEPKGRGRKISQNLPMRFGNSAVRAAIRLAV